ncbi:expressed unknown protein [Seminavis robusta]|uniref:Uncharacterized protein n=1 Tax=Seminavis robusta TaxID=568900 RepID=A0A9N8EUT4_9STRA|nr:expressed unknown protein [Seminavis robusta]|eukprot:Sro2014_g311020.1 n/a (245) ;mRNA; r:11525-12259
MTLPPPEPAPTAATTDTSITTDTDASTPTTTTIKSAVSHVRRSRKQRVRISPDTEEPVPSADKLRGKSPLRRVGTTVPQKAGPPLLRSSTVPENSLSQNRSRRALPAADTAHKDTATSKLLQKISNHVPNKLRLRPAEEPTRPVDPMQVSLEQYHYSTQDTLSIVTDREAFQNLKQSLRQRRCVTNAYLKMNFHFYVQHCKRVREARHQYELKVLKQQRKEAGRVMSDSTSRATAVKNLQMTTD